MGAFSLWHWAIVLIVLGVPVWILVRHLRERRTSPSNTEPSGIGGWLAFMAFGLCLGLFRNVVGAVGSFSTYMSGFRNPDGHLQLIVVGLLTVAYLIVSLLVIVALFQKRRATRHLFLVFWILTALVPLSLLLMLTVPGVRLEKIYSAEDIGWNVARVALVGLWYWYLCVSVRVRNTLTN
ncbi:DUF2569 family protein [Reyranella sp.]|uniref:DUF2569 family protein n=1 Tax=Reyranella sp. TaxID=1929291 RepID=UPI00122711D5|nr:DUF2569 family protein [Reyranella sp.]TAJ83169.1 MAG: DUF2569 family protein [Reyranella sp.]